VLKQGFTIYFYAFVFWYILLYKGLLMYLATSHVFETVEVTNLNVNSIR